MKTLDIGFMGTGWIAGIHARSLSRLPGIRITALCNHHLDKALEFNLKHAGGQARCFDDWQKMLSTQRLDALYIAIPPGAHVGQTELAAEKGIHLMLEKPIALTSARADSIAAAVRKAGVICQIGHHMRHSGPVMKLKDMLRDGSAGQPLFMQGRFFANALFPAWWRDPQMGGGQLIEQSIHLYDLARHFFGEPQAISAFADNLLHRRFTDYRVDDVSASVIRFYNGGIASLCASNCAEPHTGSITFTVQCEKVVADFASPDTARFVYTNGKITDELPAGAPPHEQVTSDRNMYDELSANFVAAIREGAARRSGIDDGVNSLRLVLAASRSAQANGSLQML